jgi:hypothetical protein
MVPGLRRDLSCSTTSVSIDAWQICLEVQPGVVDVQPLLHIDGSSRKSVVDPHVIKNGGGHLCPYELQVFIGERTKKARVTAGLTRHGGALHVYFRELSEKLDAKMVKKIFYGAASMLEEGRMQSIPPPPTRPVPIAAPTPIKPIEIPPPPTRPCPLPHATDKMIATQPPPPLPTYDFIVLGTFDSAPYGHEYMTLIRGEKLRLLPTYEDCQGWWYGEVEVTGCRGWFPPSHVAEEF